jgi:hypothetical protein
MHKLIQLHKASHNELYTIGYLCWKEQRQISELVDQKNAIIEQLKVEHENFLHGDKCNNLFSGTAFFTFTNRKTYERFYSQFPHSIYFMLFNKIKYYCQLLFASNTSELIKKRLNIMDSIRVVSAPEPEDIIWENLHYSPVQRLIRAVWVYLITILLIAISFGAIIGLTFLQRDLKSNQEYIETGYSIAISLIVTIINTLISFSLKKLSE